MRPYGWNRDGSLIRDEADTIRGWADHILAGGKVKPLVAQLNDAGIPTAQGKRWSSRSITRALINPRMVGLRQLRDGSLVEAPDVEAILDRDQWDQLVTMFNDPDRQRFSTRRPPALLSSGLLRCGRCGNTMYTAMSSDETLMYRCQSEACPAPISIHAHIVEPEVAERLLVRVTSPGWLVAVGRITTHSVGHYEAVLADIDSRIIRLAEEFGGLESSEPAFTAGLAAARAARETTQRSLHAAATLEQIPELTSGDVVEWWADTATIDDKRRLIDLVIDHVTVKPRRGNPTVSDRLDYTWRD